MASPIGVDPDAALARVHGAIIFIEAALVDHVRHDASADRPIVREAIEAAGALAADMAALRRIRAAWPSGLTVVEAHAIARACLKARIPITGETAAICQAYLHAQVPITPETLAANLGAHCIGDMRPLGGGAFCTVLEGDFEGRDGRFPGVFKSAVPVAQEALDVALQLSIDPASPRWALRNIATKRIDDALNLGLVPRPELAVHDGRLGTLMARAGGVSPMLTGDFSVRLASCAARRHRQGAAHHPEGARARWIEATLGADDVLRVRNSERRDGPDGAQWTRNLETVVVLDMRDALLRRELTKLQWLDALTGQGDRHAHNYLVERTVDGLRVAAIDNDQSFGATRDPDELNGSYGAHVLHGFALEDAGSGALRGAMLPVVIDGATAAALLGLDDARVDALLGGLLNEAELDATKARLGHIQRRIAALERDGGVYACDAAGLARWSSPDADARLGVQRMTQELDRIAGDPSAQPIDLDRLTRAAGRASYIARETLAMMQAVRHGDLPWIYGGDLECFQDRGRGRSASAPGLPGLA